MRKGNVVLDVNPRVNAVAYMSMMRAKARMALIARQSFSDVQKVEKFAAWLDAAIEFDAAAEQLYDVKATLCY